MPSYKTTIKCEHIYEIKKGFTISKYSFKND